MDKIIILSAAVPLLAGLLMSEKKESLKGILLTKPFLSGLFIVMAVIQTGLNSSYYNSILAGLVFCFIGDICLAFFFNRKVFTAGLAFFLTGHLFYVVAFFSMSGVTTGTWVSVAATGAVSITVFLWLKSRLDSMLVPVIAYILIISMMVIGAGSLAWKTDFDLYGRLMVLVGALIFYCSDLFVARHRFVEKNIINRFIGLPMYYTAQFTLAFSVGIIG